MEKLTYEEFNKLSREEKQKAVLNFTAPSELYKPKFVDNRILLSEEKC
jgi:hypothetical protein